MRFIEGVTVSEIIRQLRDLRDAIRDRASTAQLRTRVDDMSKSLVRLDKQKKQKQQKADENPLMDLLEALSLPKGTGRQTKALRKQLDSLSGGSDTAAIASFAALIHSAMELSSDEVSPDTDGDAKSGLFQRLFGSQDKGEKEAPDSPDAPAAKAARARTTGTVREILIQLLERLSLPEELVGKQIIVVANLAPRKIRGEESNGMLLAASAMGGEDGNELEAVVLLQPGKAVPNGSEIH